MWDNGENIYWGMDEDIYFISDMEINFGSPETNLI